MGTLKVRHKPIKKGHNKNKHVIQWLLIPSPYEFIGRIEIIEPNLRLI